MDMTAELTKRAEQIENIIKNIFRRKKAIRSR